MSREIRLIDDKPFAEVNSDWQLGEIPGLLRSLKGDLWTRRTRYQIIESLLRNVNGRTGQYLRYRILARFFRKAGTNIQIFEGIRIRDPSELVVGSNVAIGMDCTLQCGGGLQLGDNVLLGAGVKIWTVSHAFADETRPISQQGLVLRPVVIGADCWLCSDCFISPGSVIPDGCVVLPKTVVKRIRIPPYSVLGGNPVRVIAPRGKLGLFMGRSRNPRI